MTVSSEQQAGSLPLTSSRRSALREFRRGYDVEIELVTNIGTLVAVLSWLPLGAAAPLVLNVFETSLGVTQNLPVFVNLASMVLVPAGVSFWLVKSWVCRRAVRIVVNGGGLELVSEGGHRFVAFDQLRRATVFRDGKAEVYGINIECIETEPIAIRAWDPTMQQATDVCDRVNYLIAEFRAVSGDAATERGTLT